MKFVSFFVPKKHEAVKNFGLAIKFVKDQPYDICMTAINNENIYDNDGISLQKNNILKFIIDKELKEYCTRYLENGTKFIKTKKAKFM